MITQRHFLSAQRKVKKRGEFQQLLTGPDLKRLSTLLSCGDLTSDNMWVRCLGFALLVCIPGVLHGSSSFSGSNERDTQLLFTTLDKCGRMPLVSHGVFEQIGRYVLKYQCIDSYKQEGPDMVVCYSNGTWSEIPTCTDNYCFVNTTEYEDLEKVGIKFINTGETETLQCEDKWAFANFALVECNDGKPKISKCCNRAQINTGLCWQRGLMMD